jgi:hypothetical protein
MYARHFVWTTAGAFPGPRNRSNGTRSDGHVMFANQSVQGFRWAHLLYRILSTVRAALLPIMIEAA